VVRFDPGEAKEETGELSSFKPLRALKRVLAGLGLTGHLHTFRHAFISKSLTAGVPEAVVREWVGHVDRDILKLDTHIASAASRAAMRRFVGEPDEDSRRDEGRRDGRGPGSARFQHKPEEGTDDRSAR
jgi:hypothetical protein